MLAEARRRTKEGGLTGARQALYGRDMRLASPLCLLLVALATPAWSQGGPPRVEAGVVEDELPGVEPWLPPLVVDEDTDLYLAQVIAGLGAEGLFGIFGLCPGLSLCAGVARPAAGALAVDWVGREMGGRQGWQLGGLVASYALYLAATGLVTTGALGLYVASLLTAVLVPSLGLDGISGTLVGVSLLGTPVAVMLGGALIMLARPFLVPLVWGITRDEDEAADPGPEIDDAAPAPDLVPGARPPVIRPSEVVP
ncbi:MAG: hypothetical protein ABIJ09_06675 [Pseudomonadota bacterium]